MLLCEQYLQPIHFKWLQISTFYTHSSNTSTDQQSGTTETVTTDGPNGNSEKTDTNTTSTQQSGTTGPVTTNTSTSGSKKK